MRIAVSAWLLPLCLGLGAGAASARSCPPDGVPGRFFIDADKRLGGNGFGIQSIAWDDRRVYTLHVVRSGVGEVATVNAYAANWGGTLAAPLASMDGGSAIGHQGLGYQAGPDGPLFWSTDAADKRWVSRYAFAPGGAATARRFRLFGEDFKSGVSSSPTISLDQRYLIAQSQRLDSGLTTIRVWRLSDIEDGDDLTTRYRHQWDVTIAGPQHPLQAIASDGRRVWIIAGNARLSDTKRFQERTIGGRLVRASEDFRQGKEIAVRHGSVFEPEGLFLVRCNQADRLFGAFIVGDIGARRTLVMEIVR